LRITERLPLPALNNLIPGLLLFFCVAVHGQNVGYLSVSVDPDVEIFLDSTLVADHSFSRLSLNVRTYELLILDKQDFSWNKKAIKETIQILADHETVRDYQSKNYRNILSQPVGSDVYLGSILLGQTPITLKEELIAGQPITLRKNGFKEKTFTLAQIDDNDYLKLNKLNPEDNPAVFEASLGGTQVNWFRESLILSSFLSSWGAFMFKRKADQNYARYLSSSFPPLTQQYYDEAQKFDRYSEIAIGISITALSIYMIILITD